MSIIIPALLPLALKGVLAATAVASAPVMKVSHAPSPTALAAPVAVQVKPLTAPVAKAQPAKLVTKLAPPKAATPAVTLPAPVVAPPAAEQGPQLIQTQVTQTPQAAAPAQALDQAAIIDKAGKALAAVKTAKGKFTQASPRSTQSGDFYISRPGKIRFEYMRPTQMFIVSDGVTVSQYEPKRKTYDAVPLAQTTFNLFLKGDVDLKRDSKVTDVRAANGSYFVTLTDKTGKAEGAITLEFTQPTFELVGWRATDGMGGETIVGLSAVEKNVTLKPALFVVKAPEDERRD